MFGVAKHVIGAIALGMGSYLLTSVIGHIIFPDLYFDFNMRFGPILWIAYSIVMYPVSKRLIR